MVYKFTPGYIIMPPKLGYLLYLGGGFYFAVLHFLRILFLTDLPFLNSGFNIRKNLKF